MHPGQRVELVKESATLLAKREWVELNLILEQFGLSTAHTWDGSEYLYAIAMLKDASDGALGGC